MALQTAEKPAATTAVTTPTPSKPAAGGPGAVTPATSTMSAPGGGGKKLPRLVVVIIVVLLLLGGAAFAYFKVFAKSPEKQIQEGIAALVRAESAAFDGEIKATGASATGAPTVTFNGQADSEKLKLEFKVESMGSEIKITLLGFANEAYIKIEGLDQLAPLFSGGDADLEQRLVSLDGTFIHLSSDFVRGFSEGLGLGSSTGAALSDEDTKKLADAIASAQFITVTEKLDSKDVGGKKAKGYRAVLSRDGIVAFMKQLKALNIEGMEITDEDIKNAETTEQKDLDDMPIDFYLQGGRLVRVEVDFDGSGGGVNVSLTFSKLGEAFTLDKPTDVTPVEDVLDLIIGFTALFGGGIEPSADGEEPTSPEEFSF